MKRFFISLSGILSVVLFFSLCYYVSFENSRNEMEQKKKQAAVIPEIMTEVQKENRGIREREERIPVEDVTIVDAIITPDTVCVYEIVYLDTDERMQYEAKPTAEIAGLTREQLQTKLKKYVTNMPVTEFEQGLISYELLSFSPERVVMQKTYDGKKVKYRYFVTVKNGEVIVYYSDKKTVFEHTGILCESLEDDITVALEIGIPINDVESLYDYLSGITS